MPKFLTVLALAAGCLAVSPAIGQGYGNSPYSRLGLGDLNGNTGNIRNFSMGGAGVASPNSNQLNFQNPALLYYNNNVSFELSAAGQLKDLKQDSHTQRDGSLTLNTLSLGVPINKRWTSAVGLKPYSSVQYEVNTTQPFVGDPAKTALVKYTGSGGLSEAYFANGVKVAKDLVLGVSGSYVFGAILNDQLTGIQGGTGYEQLKVSQVTNYYNFLFKSGLAYRHKVGKYNLGIGAVYSFGADIDAKRQLVLERPVVGGTFIDTVQHFTKGSAKMPAGIQGGLSFDNGSNWSVVLDVDHQQLQDFQNYDGQKTLVNATRVALGGEFVPEPSSTKYFKRVAYRAGFYYGKSPYELGGTHLNSMGVTWGFAMPLGRSLATESNFLNLGFAAGKRGTTDSQLIQENYIQMQVGVTLNSKWFIRRQLD